MSDLAKRLIDDFEDEEVAHDYMDDFINSSLAAQLKVLREDRGWTQEELAERAGMKQERISVLEDVNFNAWTAKTLRKLARAFDVSLQISFQPFTKAILIVANLSRDSLKVPSREEDLKTLGSCKFSNNNGRWVTVSVDSRSAPVQLRFTEVALNEPITDIDSQGWRTLNTLKAA
jgi:transcriptional regulator with XRE-family HTH domain